MRFDIITLFPEVIEAYCQASIVGRAFSQKIASLHLHQLRNWGLGAHRKVDDIPYGGGVGMVLRPEPIFAAHGSIPKANKYRTILFTPRGHTLKQSFLREELCSQQQLIMICGHYEGIDERVLKLVDHEISLGQYVLTGGELGAMIMIDALVRLLPGVLDKGQEVHTNDSFAEGLEIEAPHYTRPREFEGMAVPEVLLSGNHAEIRSWREQQQRQYNDGTITGDLSD